MVNLNPKIHSHWKIFHPSLLIDTVDTLRPLKFNVAELTSVVRWIKPTFDDRQTAPLDLLPTAAHQPRVDFLQQLCEVVWVRLHDLVKFSKLTHAHRHKNIKLDLILLILGLDFSLMYLSRAEEHTGQSKLEVVVIESQSFEQSLDRFRFTL